MSVISIIGSIGEEVIAQEVRDGLESSDNVVELYIDSPGGDVIESNAMSLAISKYALSHPEKEYVCTLGSLCASAAANIVAKLPGCFRVRAYKDTLVMYHSCTGVVEGNPEQLLDYSVMMRLVNDTVARELGRKTTIPVSEIQSAFMTGRELWLDGRQALEVGLVSELVDAEPEKVVFKDNAGTRQVLALVATYKQKHLEEIKMEEEKKEVIAEAQPEATAEATAEVTAETEVEKTEIEKEIEKEEDTPPEVDWEAKCGELRQECDELKKEVEALKALVAKYQPTAKPQTAAPKADWLTMVRELNAKHLPEAEYAKEYVALKKSHETEFKAFMGAHTVR